MSQESPTWFFRPCLAAGALVPASTRLADVRTKARATMRATNRSMVALPAMDWTAGATLPPSLTPGKQIVQRGMVDVFFHPPYRPGMDRRRFLLTSLSAGIAAPLAAEAQAAKLWRVGFLVTGSLGGHVRTLHQGFEQELGKHGWVIARNLVIDYRSADGEYNRLPALATELVQLEPDVMVAVSTAAARAAKDATSRIPIVMWGVSDPVGDGLIANFARPGGNVTGLAITPTWDLYAKQLELLKEALSRAKRIALLWNPANPVSLPAVKAVEKAAPSLGVELHVVGARTPSEFAPAFRTMTEARADALLIIGDSMFFTNVARLAELSIRHRLPATHGAVEYAQAGGFMAYAVNRAEAYRRVAGYVDKLLRGAYAGDLPVEQPTKFELAINLATAKALGLTIPPSLLLRADRVIEQ
jgi:putative tryptophan/tyrosine transport system substrate-binding protein